MIHGKAVKNAYAERNNNIARGRKGVLTLTEYSHGPKSHAPRRVTAQGSLMVRFWGVCRQQINPTLPGHVYWRHNKPLGLWGKIFHAYQTKLKKKAT